jgi:predicted neuraminidase
MLLQTENKAFVLMRHTGDEHRQLIGVTTVDGGQNWTVPVKLGVLNPDAAVSAVVLPDGQILAVLNNMEQGRNALSLMISADNGRSWKNIYQLEDQQNQLTDEPHYLKIVAESAKEFANREDAEYVRSIENSMCANNNCRFEFSYPYLIQVKNGDFHLVYTWNRSFIKHVWFSQSWLDLRLKTLRHD